MRNINIFLLSLICLFIFNSCELDNYDGPNSTISGGIYDIETGELVPQDIIIGAQIEYVEHGFTNPETQYMVIKPDGTYNNNLMFANKYTMHLVRGNFVPINEIEVDVKGDTKLDFTVQPYVRVKNLTIEKESDKIVATFNIQQTVPEPVIRIGLYAHPQDIVGVQAYTVRREAVVNAVTNESTLYRLEIDIPSNSRNLKEGNYYYFRVGAIVNVPQAKLNYGATVKILI